MPSRIRFVLGCFTAFLAGLAIAQTMSHVNADPQSPRDRPEITTERGADNTVVLRPSVSGKSYAVLVEPGRGARPGSSSPNEITFHRDSLTLDLKEGATARIYELRRIMECGTDCKPCLPGPADVCVVPPVPVVPPVGPSGGYRVHFLAGRP